MLERGFTTVRDTGGADWGLKAAVDQGLIEGPRLFISGRAIGPTGGHVDMRRRTDAGARCGCCHALAFATATADGEAEVRKVVREEMRQGCDQVKILGLGPATLHRALAAFGSKTPALGGGHDWRESTFS